MLRSFYKCYRLPLLMATVIAVLGSLPYAYGYATAPDGQRFMGFVGRGTPAANAYLMFARQARDGDPTMHNQYQPVPPDRDYLNLEWWAFGMLARITGCSLIALFHLGRILSVFAYCLALYYFLGVMLRADQQRRYAFFFILFGTGFGWLILLGRKLGLIDWALPLDVLGVNIPGYLINKPHFIRGMACALGSVALLARGVETGDKRYWLASGGVSLLHAVIRPFHLPVMLLLYPTLALFYRFRKPGKNYTTHSLLAILPILPALLYYSWVARTNPLGIQQDAWLSQNLIEQILWLSWPFTVMVIFLLVMGGRLRRWQHLTSSMVVLWGWLLICWGLELAHPLFPTGNEHTHPAYATAPLVLLVLHIWPTIKVYMPSLRRRRLILTIALILALPSTLYTYQSFFTHLHSPPIERPWRYYFPEAAAAALNELADNPPAVLLADEDLAQFIPRLSPHRVVLGHHPLTPDYNHALSLSRRFYTQPGPVDWKQAYLEKHYVTHVLCQSSKCVLSHQKPSWLIPLFQQDDILLYRANP